MKFIKTLVFTCFSVSSVGAQKAADQRKFDSIYFATAVTVAAEDINKATRIADSLYRHSKPEIFRLKALMLSSSLFQQKGDIKKSVQYAVKADSIAVSQQFYDWEARIAGFLSTQYRIMGLYEEGEEYLEKGKNVSNKIENEQMKKLYLGMIYQETAYYEIEYEKYKKAYKAAKTADNYFKQLTYSEQDRDYFLATNEQLLGQICTELKKWDEAYDHYTKAQEKLTKVTQENAMLSGFIYSGLGRVYLEKNDLKAAFENLQKAEKIVEKSDYLELKIEVYKTLADYYQLSKDFAKYSEYNDKYVESLELSEKKKKESITDFVKTTKSEGKVLAYNKNVLLIVSIALCVLVVLIIIWHRRSRKRDRERFREVMNRMKQAQLDREQEKLQPEVSEKKDPNRKIMSDAIEAKILKDLKDFESGNKYTDKQISLSMLAGMLNTNTKYLSHVLNTYLNKDFNTYINELRIKYIIEKIEQNEKFKNYKLSVLAEECGFSSHSKFSAVFKSVTGLSPSTFLAYMEESRGTN
ncbi:MAG: helix-turn-helix protein AraC type [Fluviicola sp.]|jgi:AraC-like DNA-binding protein|uniref:helix-turn-helix domain-containing protein n=1 Tax=Fluviicola sp. TaxID=1917219 RepID=UPI002637E08F|nr:helix-turn-helix domain-containing protein [Fluviicola sp.]MDF3026441.1 helix-turn-helix protein AraC type [Fluviicola sp.]